MNKVYGYIIALGILFIPSVAFAADLDITCYENEKPVISAPSGYLFDLSNFTPGDSATRTVKVENKDPNNNCRIYFKGEGSKNDLTDEIQFQIQDVFSDTLTSFVKSDRVLVADVAPNQTVNRDMIISLGSDKDNSVSGKKTNFDIRVISEWGSEINDNNDVLGTSDSKTTTSSQGNSNTTEAQPEQDVKGVETCIADKKLYGYVYVDKNKDDQMDDSEDILEGISVHVYKLVDENQEIIANLTTDKKGYWETEVCEGSYSIEILKDSIPRYFNIDENIKGVTLASNDTELGVNIAVVDYRNFWQKYWILILSILLLVAVLSTGYIFLKNKKK